MKRIFVFMWMILVTAFVFAQERINDPNAEVREAKDFHAISVSNAFDVFLSQGNEEAVAVSASEKKYMENIKVEVKEGVLRISFGKEGRFWNGWNGNKMRLKAYITFKNLDKLRASGACDLKIQGTVHADKLDIDLSGACDLKGALDIKNLTVSLSGASDFEVSGTAIQLSVDASGASDFKGFEFLTDYCEAKASGASNIKITVNKELSAHASGASDVHYKGNGMIKEIKTSGASNVSKRS